uniref:Uncharacterized protein n=1 Tax=Rhizophora mucronata TaxID=61149 RepID=A0A2P2P4B1_RHIMU
MNWMLWIWKIESKRGSICWNFLQPIKLEEEYATKWGIRQERNNRQHELIP